MATQQDSILGLFTTPEQYQLSRDQQLATNQLELAKLSPEQRAVYNIGQGFRGAVDVGARALGANDPQLQLLSLRNQLAQGKDLTSFEGWSKYTQDLQKAGDLQGAAAAAQRATELRSNFEEKQATRDTQLQIARERIQANIDMARERGATQLQIAQMMQEGRTQLAQLTAALKTSQPKALPASLQKDESKDLETIDTYTAQQQALQPAISSLTPNEKGVRKLELGPVKNLQYAAQNLAGNSTPESRAYEGLKSAVDTAVNLQVSAEKGVQTDKDVLRFAQALIAAYGRNDSEATLQALKRYNDSLAKAQDRTKSRLESRRKSQGVDPYFTGQEQRPQGTMENPIVLK